MKEDLSDLLWREKRPKAKPEGVEEDNPGLFRRKGYLTRG